MPKLICLCGLNKGEEYDLVEGANSLGRSEKNTICVFDKKVSRHHCTIFVKNGEFSIEDNSSTNGSRLNNVFLSGRTPVNYGDHIRIGQTIFIFSDRSVAQTENKSTEKEEQEYESLLQEASFQVTKTTALRKLRTDKEGKATGFLTFFKREEQQNKENENGDHES